MIHYAVHLYPDVHGFDYCSSLHDTYSVAVTYKAMAYKRDVLLKLAFIRKQQSKHIMLKKQNNASLNSFCKQYKLYCIMLTFKLLTIPNS